MDIARVGNRAYTPELSKMFSEGYVMDVAASMDKEVFENDWEQREPEMCPMCDGAGHNPQHPEDKHCVNCEGTGMSHILVYGVKSKQTYMYVEEFGINAKKEFCKAMREAHEEIQKAGKVGERSMVMPYALPKYLEMELIALGYNPNGADGAEVREIAAWVSMNAPEYLCVNYRNF